jgi:hypothetical protein
MQPMLSRHNVAMAAKLIFRPAFERATRMPLCKCGIRRPYSKDKIYFAEVKASIQSPE